MATKSPSTNTSTSTNRCTISTKSCRKSTTSKPRPKGFLNKSSILGIHPYLGSGVALQHFLFGVRSRIATFSQQSTTEDRRKTTVFEARCCIAIFSPVSPVGGTGRKIASGKYRKPYAGRDQRPETRDQRPETRDQGAARNPGGIRVAYGAASLVAGKTSCNDSVLFPPYFSYTPVLPST